MHTVFCSPSRYTQGSNSTLSLGKEMTTLGLGGPALVLAGNSAITLLSETWRLSLGEAGFAFQVYRFGGECSIAEIDRVKRQAREQSARVIVGAGGRIGIEPQEIHGAIARRNLDPELRGATRRYLENFVESVQKRNRPDAAISVAFPATLVCQMANLSIAMNRAARWDATNYRVELV